jgi:hypothetical protein
MKIESFSYIIVIYKITQVRLGNTHSQETVRIYIKNSRLAYCPYTPSKCQKISSLTELNTVYFEAKKNRIYKQLSAHSHLKIV